MPPDTDNTPTGSRDNATEIFSGWRWVVPLLAVLTVVFFSRFLLTGRFFLMRDLIFDFFPREEFYKRHLLQGVLPLWNHYTAGGEPFLSNMESGVFYPLNLLYLLFSVPTGNCILVTFHVFLAGCGTWLACRALRVSTVGSLLAAVAFAFSTQTITRIEFFSFLCSYAWYPMAVAIFTLWLQRPSWQKFILLAMIFSLQILGGYPEALLFTLGTLTIEAIAAVVLCSLRGKRSVLVLSLPFLVLTGTILLALMLSMAQVLPVMDILPNSLRNDLDPGLNFASVNPRMFLTALYPYAYGTAGRFGKYWAPNCLEFWLGTFYVGLIPIMLCLTVAVRIVLGQQRARQKIDRGPIATIRTPFLLSLLVFSMFYAMGGYTPLFTLLWKAIPFLQWFRWPSKALMCVTFALSCLAGVALDRLRTVPNIDRPTSSGRRSFVVLWAPTLLWLGLAGFMVGCLIDDARLGQWVLHRFFNLASISNTYSHRIPWQLLRDHAVLFTCVILSGAVLIHLLSTKRDQGNRFLVLLLLLLFTDLFFTTKPLIPASDLDIMQNHGPYKKILLSDTGDGRFYRTSTQQYFYGIKNERLIRAARDTMSASWPMVDEVHAIKPMGDFKLANYSELLSVFIYKTAPEPNALLMLRKLGCSTFFESSLRPGYFEDGDIFAPEVTAIGPPIPSAYVVGRIQSFPDRQSLIRFMTYGDQKMQEVALVEQGELDDPDLSRGKGLVPHRILRHDYVPNGLEVEVESARKGLLILHETYYHGWEATVNDGEVPIYQVNGAFRGVVIPAGRSLVTMEYRPRTLNLGLGISVGTLAVALTLLATANRLPWARAKTSPFFPH